MDLSSLYVTVISYIGLISACVLTMISSYAAWHKDAAQDVLTKMQHIVVDAILSFIVGALCPVFTIFAIFSFLYDRDSFMSRIYC